VQKDVNGILRRYDRSSDTLGDEFWNELMTLINRAAESPERFHSETPILRRANLKRFPYHFLYRIIAGGLRLTVVRHHKRHPRHGLDRI
jgi:hypothetical protein